MTSPTPAAVRAAEAICGINLAEEVLYPGRVALAIDAEFAEIVAALREARERLFMLGLMSMTKESMNTAPFEARQIIERIDAALAHVDATAEQPSGISG